jgi:hypothetical protein
MTVSRVILGSPASSGFAADQLGRDPGISRVKREGAVQEGAVAPHPLEVVRRPEQA